jgi:nicotinate-nucleotide adenylyltransferase
MRSIGILGGTFDPIHNAHLRLAHEALEQLQLDEVRLIPLNIPPHRESPIASSLHRKKMIELAIEDEPKLCLDCRELDSEAISYSINTLKSLRQEFVDDSLNLILGRDAFNKIDSWKDWQEVLHYAHIVVANRPNESSRDISNDLNEWIEKHKTNNKTNLTSKLSGHIYFINIPELDISSSKIRQNVKENKIVDNLLPAINQNYIKDNHLYLDTA